MDHRVTRQTGDNRRMGDDAGRMVFLGFEENQLT